MKKNFLTSSLVLSVLFSLLSIVIISNRSYSCDPNEKNCGYPLNDQNRTLLHDGAEIVDKVAQHSTSDRNCRDVPPSQLRKKEDPVFTWENEFYCDNASQKGFLIRMADIVFLGKTAKKVVESDDLEVEAEWDPSAAISAAVQKATHPQEVKKSWWKTFLAEQKENILPGFDCYTSKIQVAAVCKAMGEGLAKAVEWGGIYMSVRSMLGKVLAKKIGTQTVKPSSNKSSVEKTSDE